MRTVEGRTVEGSARLAGAVTGALIALTCMAAPARATVFTFQEMGSTVPGVQISGTISVNGGLADLPTLSNVTPPAGGFDFGNLTGFDLGLPINVASESHYTLSSFTAPSANPALSFPRWSISPTGIDFVNAGDTTDFHLAFSDPLDTIGFQTDAPVNPADCGFTGHCMVMGEWVADPVPEPSSAGLLAIGALLCGCGSVLRRVRRRVRPV